MRSVAFALCVLFVVTASDESLAAPPITAAAFAPDGNQVVIGSQNGLDVRSWPELQPVASLPAELRHVHDLAFSPDGTILLAAGGAPAEYGAVVVLSWPDGRCIRRVTEHTDLVYRVAWSPDGSQWATASADGRCGIFAAETGRLLAYYEGHSRPVLALSWLNDGTTIASAGVDQTLRLWESATGRHLRTLDNHVGTINDLATRPAQTADAPVVVATVSEDRTVRLWQPTIGRLMRFARLPSVPRVVAWTKDGRELLVGCNDGVLRTLDADTVEIVAEQRGLSGRLSTITVNATRQELLLAGEGGEIRSVSLLRQRDD